MALEQLSPPVSHHIGFSIPHLMLSVIALLEHPFAEGEDRFGRRRCVRKRTQGVSQLLNKVFGS